MLSFSTEFPLNQSTSPDSFLASVKAWILASPHTAFSGGDLDALQLGAPDVVAKNARVSLAGAITDNEAAIAVRYTVSDHDVDWITEIAFSSSHEVWASVRTFRDATIPTVNLPTAKKPVVVMTLLDRHGGGQDGDIEVSRRARTLKNDEIDLASRLLTGESGCYLPVVYVSSTFDGTEYVGAEALARDLCGMAHVIVEPNRPFSQRLQLEVNSINAYGGAIGIYWPDGAGRHILLPNRSVPFSERRQFVSREVRSALLNRRPLQWCSWSAAQQLEAKAAVEKLRAAGSGEVDEYIKNFDLEMGARNKQLQEAEEEIRRLKASIRLEAAVSAGAGIGLKISSEQDYFPGEISNIVRDVAVEGLSRVQENGRREHILRAIVSSNPASPIPQESRDRLKSLLRDYRSMTREIRDGLADLGFSLTEDGKHYKAVYNSDDRYVFAIPKTPSDHRGGLNLASDIAKRIF